MWLSLLYSSSRAFRGRAFRPPPPAGPVRQQKRRRVTIPTPLTTHKRHPSPGRYTFPPKNIESPLDNRREKGYNDAGRNINCCVGEDCSPHRASGGGNPPWPAFVISSPFYINPGRIARGFSTVHAGRPCFFAAKMSERRTWPACGGRAGPAMGTSLGVFEG